MSSNARLAFLAFVLEGARVVSGSWTILYAIHYDLLSVLVRYDTIYNRKLTKERVKR